MDKNVMRLLDTKDEIVFVDVENTMESALSHLRSIQASGKGSRELAIAITELETAQWRYSQHCGK